MNQPRSTSPGGRPGTSAPSIPGYRITSRLGAGGMGVVYKAVQLSMNRPVAIKLLYHRYLRDGEALERFRREVINLSRLSHPNIVLAIDCGQVSGTPYYVMEFVDGATLTRLVKKRGPLSESECLDIGGQIARALAHAARHKLVHRDIKPDNIMVTDEGVAKLCDLGIAKSLEEGQESSLTTEGVAIGTPNFLSPEQAQGLRCDERSDIYSLGATLFYAATGNPPFEGKTAAETLRKHLTVNPPKVNDINRKLSPGFARLIQRMLAKDPDKRFPSAWALWKEIERLQKGGGQGGPARRIRAEPDSAATGTFVKAALITATLLLVSALSILVYVTHFTRKQPSIRRAPTRSTRTNPGKPESPLDNRSTRPTTDKPQGAGRSRDDPRAVLSAQWDILEPLLRNRTRTEEAAGQLRKWKEDLAFMGRLDDPDAAREFVAKTKTRVRAILSPRDLDEISRIHRNRPLWAERRERVLDLAGRVEYLQWLLGVVPEFVEMDAALLQRAARRLSAILAASGDSFQLCLNVLPVHRARLIRLAREGQVLVDGGEGKGGPFKGKGPADLAMPVGIPDLPLGAWEIVIQAGEKRFQVMLDATKIRPGMRVSVWGTAREDRLRVRYH